MQIHEITKGRKDKSRTDEGILDDLKAAVTATKTGFKKGGVLGALKNLGSNAAYQQALQQNQRAATNKNLDKLEKKWQKERGDPNFRIKRPVEYYKDKVTKDPQLSQERKVLDAKAEQTFVMGEVLPDPGQYLVVTANNGKYFKDSKGKWYNQVGEPLPGKSKVLDDIIDTDQYSQVSTPDWLANQPATKRNNFSEQLSEGPLAQRAQQRNVGVTTPVQATQTQKIKPEVKPVQPNQPVTAKGGAGAFNQMATQAKAAGQRGKKPSNIRGKTALRKGFEQWIGNNLEGFANISKADKPALDKIFKRLVSTKAEADLDDYILTAQALILKANTEGAGEDDTANQNPGGMSDQIIQRLKQTGWKSQGNADQDAELRAIGVPIIK